MKRSILCSSVAVIIVFFFLTGCAGNDSGTWRGAKDGAGNPLVGGNYTLVSDATNYSCSNGAVLTMPAINTTASVTQTGADVLIAIDGIGDGVSNDPLTVSVTVDTLANFSARGIYSANLPGISGSVIVTYELVGGFTPSGWSGTYSNTLNFQDYDLTCYPKRSFSGSKQ